jgi:hypothetical protein
MQMTSRPLNKGESVPETSSEPSIPRAPMGLATAGKALWRAVCGQYELEQHEYLLLREAARCADRLDRLAEEALASAVTVTNFRGDQVVAPAMVEARQQSITLSRLLASLRLPSGEEDERPQRRGASRGSYGIRGVV